MNRENLPVEILDKELPEDTNKHSKIFLDEQITPNSSSGFANACVLGAIMAVCFLWGMLAVILKGV